MQRVVDDIERAIRSARFTDFEEGLDTLQQALYLAIGQGTLRRAVGDAPDPLEPGLSWPPGPAAVKGLARLDRLCLRERLSDYSQQLHGLRQRWMIESIVRGHRPGLRDATTSLYREYGASREESRDGDRQLVVDRAARLLFSNLNHIRQEYYFALDRAERYALGCVLVEAVQRYVGDLLEHGDYDAACDWLDDLSRYLSMQRLSGEEKRDFTSRMAGGPSLQAYARVAGMSVAGRALELDAGPVLDRLKNQWLNPDSSAFPADATAGDLTWVPSDIGRITASWQSGTLGRTGAAPDDWRAAFLDGRYALVFYLWVSAHLVEGEALRDHTPDDEDVVQALRGLWSDYGEALSDTLYGETEQAKEAQQLVSEWLGITTESEQGGGG